MQLIEKAANFWHWFARQERDILDAVRSSDDDWLRSELTTRVLGLLPEDHAGPRINWEIGPGQKKPWRFSLSPLVKMNLPLTRQVVAVAPELPLWEVFPAKPPRQLMRQEYRIVEVDGTEHKFQIDHWDYVLTRYKPGSFSILLLGSLSQETEIAIRKKAAHIIVEGILGEEFVLEHIVETDLQDVHEADPGIPRSKLRNLEPHLAQLLT
jgi:hypothetical protein